MLAKIVKQNAAAGLAESQRFRTFSLKELSLYPNVPVQGVSSFAFPTIGSHRTPSFSHYAVPELTMEPGELLAAASGTAASAVAKAESERKLIEDAAYERAFADVRSTIDAEIAERAASEIGQMRELLASTIHTVSSLSAEITAGIEVEIVKLAIEIARKIVEREITMDPDVAVSVVKRSLARLHDRSVAEVHLHPIDLAHVRAHQDRLGFRGTLDLREDESVAPGGCIIHTDSGDVDARIESQIDEIASGLLSDGALLSQPPLPRAGETAIPN
jgi:flagellar assembly protein FliH